MVKFLSIFFVILMASSLFYAKDLTQKNREEIFMQKDDYQAHLDFINKIETPSTLLMASTNDKSLQDVIGFAKTLLATDSILSVDNFDRPPKHLFELKNQYGQAAIVLLPEDKDESSQIVSTLIPYARNQDPNFAFSGVAFINFELDQSSHIIQTFLFPLVFFLCFLGLIVTLRNLNVALLIFLPSLLTTGLSLALIKVTLGHLDMVTSTIPLLIFILNLTMGLHLCLTRLESNNFQEVIHEKKRPIYLMVMTTAIGFGSLMISDIPVIRSFAWLSSLLILLSHFLHVLIVSPFYDIIFPKNFKLTKSLSKLTSYIFHIVKRIKITSALVFILFMIGILISKTIPVHTQAAHYFPQNSPITLGQEFIHAHFLGNPNLEILLKINDLDFEKAQELAQVEAQIQSGVSEQIISAGTLVKEANGAYSGNYNFPENKFAWSALMGRIPYQLKDGLLNDEYYRITILGPLLDTSTYLKMIEEIKKILHQSNFSEYHFGGLYYTLIKSQTNLIQTLAISFSTSLLIMAIIAFIFYPQIKIFCVFLFVNILPLGLSLIGFKILGLSFNVATIMTFSISLGMIVDGTFHIIHSFQSNDIHERFLSSTLVPIFISSSILGLCFLSFSPIGFLPIREFGMALSLNAFIGLFFDLAILPKILLMIKDDSRSSGA